MCNIQSMFTVMTQLGCGENMTLGDRSPLNVAGEGMVDMDTILTDGTKGVCALKNVLYVPELSYSLVSVS